MPPKKRDAASEAAASKRRKVVDPSDFAVVRKERIAMQKEAKTKTQVTLESLNLAKEHLQVVEMPDDQVQREVEAIVLEIGASILAGKGFAYAIPSRNEKNQKYIPELDRMVLKLEPRHRPFANSSSVRKTTITTRVLELIHQVVKKRIHITKRDLFYTDVKLFKKQDESDAVLDDVATLIGCTRTSLNVVASDKGVVIGQIKFLEDGDSIDCTKMGVGGKAIPSLVSKITNIESKAEFVLLVEKDAAFMRLAEDRFYNQYPCIIITGKGQPDVSTRLFLKMIKDQLNIPILGLFDSDPYGLKIMSVYMSSSKNMSYDSAALATSDIRWLGVRPTDLNRYKIPQQCRLEMTAQDIKEGERLLKEDFVQKNPAWVKELELMLKTKEKAEIQALSSFGFQYLTEDYLPKKIKNGDWI
eukprot:m.43810 g.43810  ORF g.43810 m.43810 type:complete len:415 (+) comp10010_c0_seq1:111-1355(+)